MKSATDFRSSNMGMQAFEAWSHQIAMLREVASLHSARMQKDQADWFHGFQEQSSRLVDRLSSVAGKDQMGKAFEEYMLDASQRGILTLDALRQRGDVFLEHEAAGAPPVLIYDYEIVVDGAKLPQPSNYILLKILAPEGIKIHDWKRPYVIVDPRAGHGAGIGGFKPDSQVGVALSDGHPVYFVAFRPVPADDQVLANVTRAEAAFLQEIRKRHPKSPKPIVIGNCQGGWATAILASTYPDLTGPVVFNGAPMSYWSGRLGQDPMRYAGGTVGGVMPALLMADLGGGLFDGANLVLNFEMLNPGRTWFRKYYDLYTDIDKEGSVERFLEFEKWWGGFYLMTGAEIRWIVENLFVGNRLARNEARLETGRSIDLKQIRAPIIVFASHGDNITPPQQALNWIVDAYADETEIRIRGQRILYMVHDDVGHLGIFVSSSVAKREHTQMASTLKTIEALPPGLYEMVIEDVFGDGKDKQFTVNFVARTMNDILALDDKRGEEAAFAAVARMSETIAEVYDVTTGPMLRSLVTQEMGEMARTLHPLRMQRQMMATNNPLMADVSGHAAKARETRSKATPDNPFLIWEGLMASMAEQSLNMIRDYRAFSTEMSFFSVFASPLSIWYGKSHGRSRTRKDPGELRALPEVLSAIERVGHGGFAEGVVRMLVLLASSRTSVRRDRLERSSEVLTSRKPFSDLEAADRTRLIHEQTLVVHFEPEGALASLPQLVTSTRDRHEAMQIVDYILGENSEMEPATLELLTKICELFELPSPQVPGKAVEAAQ